MTQLEAELRKQQHISLAPRQDALALVDRRYPQPSFRTRRRELGFEVLLRFLGRENYERVRFWRRHGRMPHLHNPVRFNEKVSARKLYEDIPSAPIVADKVAVRSYVASLVGDKYLNEMFRVTSDPARINFDLLPEAFVAKANHGSRMNIFVTQKSATDLDSVRDLLAVFLRKKIARISNEWWYDGITPQILLERYMDIAVDYQFFVFHGVAQFVKAVHTTSRSATHFDRDWQPQDFGLPSPECEIQRPQRLDEMIEVAEALSSGFSFVRVDLSSPEDRGVVFGELTLAPGSGWSRRSETEEEVFGALW